MNRTLHTTVLVGLLGLLLIAGCSQPEARPRVHGKATFQGEPLAGQSLVLYSEGGPGEFSTQTFPIQADGGFSGEVPAPGKYRVAITESLAAHEGVQPRSKLPLPARYRTPADSGLEWDIHAGDNPRDFDLQK
jgi:hypothetical protein